MAERKRNEFDLRLKKHHDELRWLYMELYDNGSMFFELIEYLRKFYEERSESLKAIDRKKEADADWYRRNDLLGMMLYIDNFGGTINGVREKLDYLRKSHVNYIHLMPFLDTVPERSDGGYAVKDFRKVQPALGTMEDLEALTEACHEKDIQVCMDFVMNHTSEDHEWAVRARKGEGEYMSRYFFFDNWDIPGRYEQTVPQVFPTTAPGNFTWLPECNLHKKKYRIGIRQDAMRSPFFLFLLGNPVRDPLIVADGEKHLVQVVFDQVTVEALISHQLLREMPDGHLVLRVIAENPNIHFVGQAFSLQKLRFLNQSS